MAAELKYVLSQMDDEKIRNEELQDMVQASQLDQNRKINFNGEHDSIGNKFNIFVGFFRQKKQRKQIS